MASSKNKGPLLTSVIRGAIEHIPPEWRARLGIKRLDQENPTDVDADAISGDTINSEVNQTRTNERKKTNNLFLVDPAGISLVQEKRLGNGQIATTTRTVVPSGTALVPPTDSIEAEQENLGIGWMTNDITEAPLPGPTIESSELDKDGVLVKIYKTRRLRSTITEGETLVAGVWTRTTIEGETTLVATEVLRVRTIPGLPMHSSKVDEDGKIVERTQTYTEAAVAIEDEILTGGTVWTKYYIEDLDGSHLITWQWVETRDIPGNPIASSVIDPDGIEVDVVKTLKDVTVINPGEPPISGGIWTETTIEPVGDLVAYEVVKARTVPGNAMIVSRSEKDGFTTTITRTMKDITTITEGETLVGSTWTRIFREDPPVFRGFAIRVGDRVAWEMKETRTVGTTGSPITTIPSAVVERDHEIATSAKMVKKAADITPSATESGGIITTVDQKEISDLVSEQITTQKAWLDEVTYEVSIPLHVIPVEFQATLPTTVESHIRAGTFSVPFSLGSGEFAHYKKQITKLLYEERITKLTIASTTTLIGQETTEEFGGGVLDVTWTLDVHPLTADTGLLVTSSIVKDLGNGYDFRITKQLHTGAWPTNPGTRFDKEMQIYTVEEEQVVAAGYTVAVPTVGQYFVEILKPIDVWRGQRIKVTKTPTAVDEGSAIITEKWQPYQFPGWLALALAGYYIRKTRAELCQHIIKTWWMSKATKPTSGSTGSGADIIIDPIIMDNIIISTLNDVTKLAYSGECLHDTLTTFGSLVWPATNPSKTTYVGTWIGTSRKIDVDISPTDIKFLWKIQTMEVVMR